MDIPRRTVHLPLQGQVFRQHPKGRRLLGGGLQVTDGRLAQGLHRFVFPPLAVEHPAQRRGIDGAGMQVQGLVRQQLAIGLDTLVETGLLHQEIGVVAVPERGIRRNRLHDLPGVSLGRPRVLAPVGLRLGVATGRIVQFHLHPVVLQQSLRRGPFHGEAVQHVERLLVQAGGNQAENRGAPGLHPAVRALQPGGQLTHPGGIGEGRIVLVALVFLEQRTRGSVPVHIVQGAPQGPAKARNPLLFLRIVLPFPLQLRIQLIQPALRLLPPQGEGQDQQESHMDPSFHLFAS